MKTVRLITDGSCKGNPGPGGWACVLKYNHHVKEMFGFAPETTNNRMEMQAAIEGLRALKEPCEVTVVTDSEYLKNGITKWSEGWIRKGWRTATGEPVKNSDLWKELLNLTGKHKTHWTWTKGHASDEENNRCDELAQRAAREQVSKR
ncbi:MAG: ribonuclease HI [Acidobacteria bacterium]|nr:ribonuclease HI [Acidobacteriota bacterium]